jgi:hypothetical protein
MNGIRICKTRAGLNSINKTGTELVIWKRSFSSSFQDWINDTDVENLPDVRILINPFELRPALEPLLELCGLKVDNIRDQLVNDIKGLVNLFAQVTQSNAVDVRLQRITNNACWKFHRDVVKTRLVTTYRGPSTEWVQHAHAEQAILEQLNYRGPLEHLGDGDVAIFKGSRTHANRGIVHRSPSIAGTCTTRLLLCLNQQTDTSPEPWVKVGKNLSHPKVMKSNEIALTD